MSLTTGTPTDHTGDSKLVSTRLRRCYFLPPASTLSVCREGWSLCWLMVTPSHISASCGRAISAPVWRTCSCLEKWPSLHSDRKLTMVIVKSLPNKFNVSITYGFIFTDITFSYHSLDLVSQHAWWFCLNAWIFNLNNYIFAFLEIPLATFQISVFCIVFFFGYNAFSFFYIYNYLKIEFLNKIINITLIWLSDYPLFKVL